MQGSKIGVPVNDRENQIVNPQVANFEKEAEIRQHRESPKMNIRARFFRRLALFMMSESYGIVGLSNFGSIRMIHPAKKSDHVKMMRFAITHDVIYYAG